MRALALTAVVGLFAMVFVSPAAAGGVVGNGDPTTCTEAALDAALANGGNVTFNCGARPFTIAVTTTKTITSDTSLDGGSLLTLSGGGRVQILFVNSGVRLSLSGATFSRGNDTVSGGGGGGAIANNGTLTVTHCTFSYNSSDSSGGAIYTSSGSPTTVSNSTFFGNVTRGRGNGGGALYSDGVGLTVTNCTFSRNSLNQGAPGGWDNGGGAIWMFNGPNVVANSTFSHNRVSVTRGGSVAGGGAIYCDSCELTVTDSAFSNNKTVNGSAGGAIASSFSGALTVSGSTFFRNSVSGGGRGGALDNGGGALSSGMNAPLIVTDSTFYSNGVSDAGKGGAILAPFLTVTNSTFSRNRVARSGDGGAIAVLEGVAGAAATLRNTIVANSIRGANCAGGAITGGHNLRWPPRDTSCSGNAGDPKLAGLRDNGGPTRTMALRTGSAAINAGDNSVCNAAPVNRRDQRGFVRPGVGMASCSIGAYEYNAAAP